MWLIPILLAMAGMWVAKHHAASQPLDVTPTTPGSTRRGEATAPGKAVVKAKPHLRLVKAVKNAISYKPGAAGETISLGTGQTIAPLLDPNILDTQAAQMRMTGNVVDAEKLSTLANQVRLAIAKKYATEPAFAAKVDAAGKKAAAKKAAG